MLDDADDMIVSVAAKTLVHAIVFIPPTSIDSNEELVICDRLIKKLLLMIHEMSGDDELFVDLDGLVRSIASIRPTQVESIIRIVMGTSTNAGQGKVDFTQFCSDIVNHCDVLAQFVRIN